MGYLCWDLLTIHGSKVFIWSCFKKKKWWTINLEVIMECKKNSPIEHYSKLHKLVDQWCMSWTLAPLNLRRLRKQGSLLLHCAQEHTNFQHTSPIFWFWKLNIKEETCQALTHICLNTMLERYDQPHTWVVVKWLVHLTIKTNYTITPKRHKWKKIKFRLMVILKWLI